MKKILCLILTLATLLSLASCELIKKDADTTTTTPQIQDPNRVCAVKEDHTDSDANGYCDTCSKDVTVTLDLYAINDLHGKLCDGTGQIGVDEMSTYLKEAAIRDEAYIILSSGDMWQGSAESHVTKGNLATEWMNEVGFVSMTLGNHEYDWGEEKIEANRALSNFPFLAINVYDRQTNERVSYCDASILVTRGDLTVGIIGAIGDCYSSISSDQVEDVYFKTGRDLTNLVKAESERLRAAGADYIIYSLHDGHNRSGGTMITDSKLSYYYDPALSRDGYVDLVFEGHTHQRYAVTDAYGVYHLQGGGENSGVSHVEVEINFVTDTGEVNEAKILSDDTYRAYDDDAAFYDLLLKYDDLIAPTRVLLGKNGTYLDSDKVAQIVADLYYDFGIETWGDRYDITLGGGFIKLRSPYKLSPGNVIYSDLLMILPFDNALTLCSIRGRDLLDKFVNTSNENYFIGYADTGLADIDRNETYYIVVDSYTALYKYNNLTVIETYSADLFARDLLADYVQAGGLE